MRILKNDLDLNLSISGLLALVLARIFYSEFFFGMFLTSGLFIAVYVFLGMLDSYKKYKKGSWSIVIVPVFALCGLLICHIGYYYPSDILFGMGVYATLVLFVMLVFNFFKTKNKHLRRPAKKSTSQKS